MADRPHTPAGSVRGPASSRPVRRVPRGGAFARSRGRAGSSGAPSSGQRSDLGARVLAAVPAIAVALFLVIEGALVCALALFVLGCICMHELYSMYDRAHPVRLAGFIALAGLLAAALYGSQFPVL